MSPSPGTTWARHAHRELRAGGHRTGTARDAVVELLATQECALSAAEIDDALRARRERVGLATVYRVLDLLHGMGLVARVELGEGTARYEPLPPGGEHHHHAVCDSCGAVTPFSDPGLEAAIERVASRVANDPGGHDVVIHETCADCSSAREDR